MAVDLDKLNFHSSYPIDKIVAEGTVSVVNDGASSHPQDAKIATTTIDNPYGSAVFARAVFSVDGTNYNSLSAHLLYTFSLTVPGPFTVTLSGLKAACSVGVSDSTVYFRTTNGLHGNVTDTGVSYIYTPTQQIFTIKYALFEKE